jgi:hypothetical protein
MDGLALVAEHGMLLQSGKGPIPNLAELVVGGPIKGSWWAHPDHDEIFRVLNEAAGSDQVVRLRLVQKKLTLVHRRLWPALVRVEAHFDRDRLASIREEHTGTGAHRTHEVPFPAWVPPDVVDEAAATSEEEAWASLPTCLR